MNEPRFAFARFRLGLAVLPVAAILIGCSGGATALNPSPKIVTLSAARATGCVYASTSAQTVPLPTAGQVSGTISIGAVPVASSTCLNVTLATGADATLAASSPASHARRPQAVSGDAMPLVQVSLTNTYTGTLSWATVTLQVPTSAVPPGTYPATVTGPGISQTVTVTVDASGNATASGFNATTGFALMTSGTTAVLSIYAAGTVLETPTPAATETPTPEPSSSATAVATATPIPTRSPTPLPTGPPTPSPSPSGSPTTSMELSPSVCIAVGNGGAMLSYEVTVTPSAPPGNIYEYGFSASDDAYTWTVQQAGTTTYSPYFGTYGPDPMASITIPTYPEGDLYGEGGYIEVGLFEYGGGLFQKVEDANGRQIRASAPIAAGNQTCPF